MVERIAYETCPLCGSLDYAVFAVADCSRHKLYDPALPKDMAWAKCDCCGHVFTGGYFGEDGLSVIFSRTQDDQAVAVGPIRRALASQIIDKVAKIARSGQWLDVGFGDGALLLTAQEYGYAPVGLDLRQNNVAALRELDVTCWVMTIEQMAAMDGAAGSYSVISMCDVLEHMPFPMPALEAARALLRPCGVLLVSCPNMATAMWRDMDAKHENPYWQELEHYHNFTRISLSKAAEQHGFEPISYGVSMRYKSGMEMLFIKK